MDEHDQLPVPTARASKLSILQLMLVLAILGGLLTWVLRYFFT